MGMNTRDEEPCPRWNPKFEHNIQEIMPSSEVSQACCFKVLHCSICPEHLLHLTFENAVHPNTAQQNDIGTTYH